VCKRERAGKRKRERKGERAREKERERGRRRGSEREHVFVTNSKREIRRSRVKESGR